MSTRYQIPGTLINEQGVSYNVELGVVVEQLLDQGRVADEAISEVKLAPGPRVRDRPYTLRYIFNGPHEDRVRVKSGSLMKA